MDPLPSVARHHPAGSQITDGVPARAVATGALATLTPTRDGPRQLDLELSRLADPDWNVYVQTKYYGSMVHAAYMRYYGEHLVSL